MIPLSLPLLLRRFTADDPPFCFFQQLIPHADVLFVNKHYAQASSPGYASSPRAFLLSLTSVAPPHALLVAHWGSEGAAVLSLPTREYFQSSGWVEERRRPEPAPKPTNSHPGRGRGRGGGGEEFQSVQSVRSGSDFWAGHRSRTPSSSAFTAGGSSGGTGGGMSSFSHSHSHSHEQSAVGHGHGHGRRSGRGGEHEHEHEHEEEEEEDDNDSQGTEMPEREDRDEGVSDEVGAQDAFVAGMIYAMSRRLAPGPPYTPASGGEDTRPTANSSEAERGRWRLDECLR